MKKSERKELLIELHKITSIENKKAIKIIEELLAADGCYVVKFNNTNKGE
jgi:hypothetical protein